MNDHSTGTAPFHESAVAHAGLKVAILAAYGVLVGIVSSAHEPWTDEAQAWLLARDSGVWELVSERVRYEGAPALWQLLLMVPAKLGLPYVALSATGALCAFAGVVLLVLYAPFPLWLRAILPFTYFLAYQYAVVARNYCLLPPLLFATAIAARRRSQSHWPFAVALILVSHVSLHATLIAGAVWLAEVARAVRAGARGDPAGRRMLLPLAALAVNFVLILVELAPPADLLVRPPFNNVALSAHFARIVTSEALVLWLPGSILALAALTPMLMSGGTLTELVLGLTFLYGLLCFRYFAAWHVGVVFVFILFCLWLAFDRCGQRASSRLARPSALAALGAIAVVQCPGTYGAARSDLRLPYSPSLEAARYLKKEGIDRQRVHALDVHSFAVLPYFDHNLFANYRSQGPGAFWIWNQAAARLMNPEAVLQGQPDYILATEKWGVGYAEVFEANGYSLDRVFRGAIFWRNGAIENDSLRLYRLRSLASDPRRAGP